MSQSWECRATREAVIEQELAGEMGCPVCGRTAEDHAPERSGGGSARLTPGGLGRELGRERREVLQLCVELGVPIFNGLIDRARFVAALEAKLKGQS